jgi:hypothetical protein
MSASERNIMWAALGALLLGAVAIFLAAVD